MWDQKRAKECSEVLDDIISQVVDIHKNDDKTTDATSTRDMHALAAEQRLVDFVNSPSEVMLRQLASGELGSF